MIDRQAAVIRTSLAFCHSSRIFHGFNIFDGKHGCTFAVNVTLTCDQCSTECAHDTGNIRTNGFAVGNLFKAPQYSVVVECSSLNNDVLTEFRCIGHLDNFK